MWFNPPTHFALIPRTIPIDTALENFSYFAIFTRSSMVEQTTPTMHLIYATWRGCKKTHAKMLQVWNIHHFIQLHLAQKFNCTCKKIFHTWSIFRDGWCDPTTFLVSAVCGYFHIWEGREGCEIFPPPRQEKNDVKFRWVGSGELIFPGFSAGKIAHHQWKLETDCQCSLSQWPTPLNFWGDNIFTRWWFQIFCIFTPIWGRFPFWLIFFRWVETTNQFSRKNKSSNFNFMIFFGWVRMSQLLCYFSYTENPS